MKVLLSIKPEYAEKIFNGEKIYEYRRSIFKRKDIDTVVVYSTKPEGKIVGEFLIDQIITEEIESLWEKTESHSGISYDFFRSYFHDKEKGFAIKIKKTTKYEKPLSPYDFDENFRAPQSFCYIN
ncbi:ASCH domain-containing protein [Priestia endophytica]|uniref:ASCH domain-containing protein n=1 Tax=Priestia endophytica TaxID=135735 RepID=UPI00227F1B4F|nr:ASCH domain-containing protein [Priestia endophytica]MCY8233463.1 ASCH domain-containing protein [Priestia endophytica]